MKPIKKGAGATIDRPNTNEIRSLRSFDHEADCPSTQSIK